MEYEYNEEYKIWICIIDTDNDMPYLELIREEFSLNLKHQKEGDK